MNLYIQSLLTSNPGYARQSRFDQISKMYTISITSPQVSPETGTKQAHNYWLLGKRITAQAEGDPLKDLVLCAALF